MKKTRKPYKSGTARHASDDQRYSGLGSHKRQGNRLLSPFNAAIGTKMTPVSWVDYGIPEMLWAVLIRGNSGQLDTIRLFREILSAANAGGFEEKETFITHSALSTLSPKTFDTIFNPIFKSPASLKLLRPLLFFEALPDRHHWLRHIEAPVPEQHLEILMHSIAACMNHQSLEATDIRWLKLVYFTAVCDRIRFALPDPDRSREMLEEWRRYPEYGDQRAVRASIRSAEAMLRSSNDGSRIPTEIPTSIAQQVSLSWPDDFWKECLETTPCIPAKSEPPKSVNAAAYMDEFLRVGRSLSHYFFTTLKNTAVSPRHDGSFGLALYVVTLCLGLDEFHHRAEGRIILRTIVESYITLRFLSRSDNATLWLQFRNYGTGQAKLAFLKNINLENLPSFIKVDDLEEYASEDKWQEFVDIDLKSWANRSLRSMAEASNAKDVYDKYYDWSSGYVHANWASIRDTMFSTCINPTHRYHRIPLEPRLTMPSTLPDAAALLNRSLEEVSTLYPHFKDRINHPDDKSS